MASVIKQMEIKEEDLVSLLVKNPSLCSKYILTEDFILKYSSYLPMSNISETQNFSSEFIEKNHEILNLSKLNEVNIRKISNAFLLEHSDKFNWNYISLIYRDFNSAKEIEFVEMFSDKLNWNYISYMDLTNAFIEKFRDKLNWDILSLIEDPTVLFEKSKAKAEELERNINDKVQPYKNWKEAIDSLTKNDEKTTPLNEGVNKKSHQSDLMKIDNLYVDANGQLHAKIGDNMIKIKIG